MTESRKVVVAMSGGVDSSVTAALLKEQGYEVTGMMLRLWSEPGSELANRCCTPDAMAQARRVAARLGIPFYAVDAKLNFYDQVVQYFLEGYALGVTPNPCLACNRQVRWDFLLDQALASGAAYMATGHYARLTQSVAGQLELRAAVDMSKDQSYVLHVLTQARLQHALFPLGEYTKPQVRELARKFNLPVAERPDSQDLCFLADGDLNSFLKRNAPALQKPGPILDGQGNELGIHQGLAFYTIGQRKGLGIASPQPLYVLAKDTARNVLVVGRRDELGQSELRAGPINWISGAAPRAPFRARVKIRYKATPAWGQVTPRTGGFVHIRFDEPLRDITPGQAAVIYDGDLCLGGGIIDKDEVR